MGKKTAAPGERAAADNRLAVRTQVAVGIVLELNGKEIPLNPKSDIANIKKHGIEVGLPPGTRVDLGAIGDGIEALVQQFNPDWKLSEAVPVNDLPSPVKEAWELLTNARVAIEALHLKIPGTETPNAPKQFTLGMSLTWPEGQGDLIGNLKLKGVYLLVTNEGTITSAIP